MHGKFSCPSLLHNNSRHTLNGFHLQSCSVHTMVRYIPVIIFHCPLSEQECAGVHKHQDLSAFGRYPRISSFLLPLSLSGRLAFIQMPHFKLHMQKCFCLFDGSGKGSIRGDFLASRFGRFPNDCKYLHMLWEFNTGHDTRITWYPDIVFLP